MADPQYVNIDGHKVDPHRVDEFYDGRTGRRVTDEEWDESARRVREAEAHDARVE
jgi:hypothetical protein